MPTRLTIVNWWRFAYQEFHLADGHLVLNGLNGSGKSTVGAVAVPVALDMVKHRRRFDPFGGMERNPTYLLIGAWDASPNSDEYHDDRTGYAFWEFRHRVTDEVVTCGVGFRARRALGKDAEIDHWGFVAPGLAHGKDFSIFEANGEPLQRSGLTQRLGHGYVFKRANEYQAAMNSALFGFDRPSQIRELTDVLVELRKPKLQSNITPEKLNESLTNALPPLPSSVTNELSDLIKRINAALETVRVSEDHLTRVREIDAAQGNYALFLAQADAVELLEAQAAVEQVETELEETRRARYETDEQLERTRIRVQSLETEEGNAKARQDVLRNSKEYLAVGRLDVEKAEVKKREEAVQRAMAIAERAQRDLDGIREARDRLGTLFHATQGRIQQLLQDVAAMGEDTRWSGLAPRLDAALVRLAGASLRADDGGSDAVLAALDVPGVRTSWTVREQVLRVVIVALEALSDAEKRFDDATRDVEQVLARRETADRLMGEARVQFEDAALALGEALEPWSAETPAPTAVRDEVRAIERQVEDSALSLDTAPSASTLIEPLLGAIAEETRRLAKERELVTAARIAQQARLDQSIKDRQALLDDPDVAPLARAGQDALRAALQRLGAPIVPLYTALDLAPDADPAALARVEEALADAGLLDALLIGPRHHEALIDAISAGALSSSAADRWLVVGGDDSAIHTGDIPVTAMSLPGVIWTTDAFPARDLATLARSFASVWSNGRSGSDGPWSLGILHGWVGAEVAEAHPRYLGESNRRRYRQARIDALTRTVREAEEAIKSVDASLAALNLRLESWSDALGTLQRHPAVDAYDEARTRARYAAKQLAGLDSEVTDAERKQTHARVDLTEKRAAVETALRPVPECAGLSVAVIRQVLAAMANVRRELAHVEHEVLLLASHAEHDAELDAQAGEKEEALAEAIEGVDAVRQDLGQASERVATIEALIASDEIRDMLADIAALARTIEDAGKQLKKELPLRGGLEKQQQHLLEAERTLEASVDQRRGSRDAQAARLGAAMERYPHPDLQHAAKLFEQVGDGYGPLGAANDLLKRRRSTEERKRNVQGDLVTARNKAWEVYRTHKDALAVYRPEWDGEEQRVIVVDQVDYRRVGPDQLATTLAAQVAEQRRAVDVTEADLYERYFIGDAIGTVRERIADATDFVRQIGEALAGMRLSNGAHFSLEWRARASLRDAGVDYARLVELVQLDPEAMSPDRRQEMIDLFRARVEAVRKATEAPIGAADEATRARTAAQVANSLADRLNTEFDYRKWFEFRLTFVRADGERVPLMKNGLQALSGGERTLAQVLPLLAAVEAHAWGAREDAPKLVYLDEAFAGVDAANQESTFAILTSLDFSWLLASDKLWGTSRALRGCATYQLTPAGRSVLAMLHVWDGTQKLTEAEVAEYLARRGPMPVPPTLPSITLPMDSANAEVSSTTGRRAGVRTPTGSGDSTHAASPAIAATRDLATQTQLEFGTVGDRVEHSNSKVADADALPTSTGGDHAGNGTSPEQDEIARRPSSN